MLGPRGVMITRELGLITYPLFLVHQIVGYVAIGAFQRFLPDTASMVLVWLCAIAVSRSINVSLKNPRAISETSPA